MQKPTVDELGYLMGRVHRQIRFNVEGVLDHIPHVTRFEQLIVLRFLAKSGGDCQQSDVIGALPMLDRHRVSRLCAEVEKLGFIKRKPNPENRRENLLFLTDAGRKTIDNFIDLVRGANNNIFEGLSDQQVLELFDVLEHILKNLETENP